MVKTAIQLAIVALLGFCVKLYTGPGHIWFNNYGAGVLYEVFWILVAFLFWRSRRASSLIPIIVFLCTSALEVLQLWHPPILQSIRSTFIGGALIGTTFVWWDFPHYILGCALGWWLIVPKDKGRER